MSAMEDLVSKIEKYLKRANVKATAFGIDAMRDPNFVFRLRSGRDYKRSTEVKIDKYIADQDKKTQRAGQ